MREFVPMKEFFKDKEKVEADKNRRKTGQRKISFWQYLALAPLLVVLLCFAARKEGYHMDELLSFELSNGEFNPWIVPTQPVGRLAKFVKEEIRGGSLWETMSNLADTGADVLKNRGNSKLLQYKADVYPEPVWISKEQFQDYVATGEEDRFSYLSVYFNVKDDNHPPLHFMLLHTMSSLFPGTIVPMLGCVINLLAILGCMICFLRLGLLLEEGGLLPKGYGGILGVGASLLYGLSAGGIATALLIRMYGLMTFFCVALFYLHVKKWLGGDFGEKNKLLIAVTVSGFLTQYFFLFYCLTLAAVTVGALAAKKRFAELGRYIRSMICAGAIGVLLFPFSVADVFSSGRGVEALQNLGGSFSDFVYRLGAFSRILAESCFGSVTICMVVLVCLAAGIVGGVVFRYAEKCRRQTKEELRREDGMGAGEKTAGRERLPLLLMLFVPVVSYFLLTVKAAPYLVDRYLMPLFPFGAMVLSLLIGVVCLLFYGEPRRRTLNFSVKGSAYFVGFRLIPFWMLAPMLLLGIYQVASYEGAYLYQGYARQLETAERYHGMPCICLYDGVGYYENLLEFTRYGRTLLVKLPELEGREDTSDLAQLKELVVLRKSAVEEAGAIAVLEEYGWEVEQVLVSGEESVYGDTVYLCRRTWQGGLGAAAVQSETGDKR